MSEIEQILLSGRSAHDDTVQAVSAAEISDASSRLGFSFPESYLQFVKLGGLAELRINHRVLSPIEILEALRYVDGSKYVPFADNGCGDLYCWERVAAAEPPVVFADHEDNQYLADSEGFIEWLRKNRF